LITIVAFINIPIATMMLSRDTLPVLVSALYRWEQGKLSQDAKYFCCSAVSTTPFTVYPGGKESDSAKNTIDPTRPNA